MPHKRSRNGCLTCRRDGYKCDERKPVCGRCSRLEKTCKGYDLQLKWRQVEPRRSRHLDVRGKPRRSRLLSSPTSRAVEVDRPMDMLPEPSLPDRRVLHHWMTVLATVVSMTPGPANPFLTELTPLLVESPALRSAVCSMAATHLHLLQGDKALQVIGERHRFRAVAGLRRTIDTGDAEISLAVALMLQVSDRLFTQDGPADHLAGARAIIQRHKGTPWSSSSTAGFLLGLYLYHDVLASVSRGSSPHPGLGNVVLEGAGKLRRLTLVLRVVGAISEMRGLRSAEAGHAQAGADIRAALDAMEDTGADDDVRKTAEAYRHAAFIYLYRTWSNVGAPHARTLDHAGACLRLLEDIPAWSALQSAHVWPLWTAGCESIDGQHRDFVRARLDTMFYLRRLPSLRRIRADIEEVWSVKDAGRRSTGTDEVDCIKAILTNRHRAADII